MFSLLGQTVFLKLHTVFCMPVSLESVTEPSRSAGPERSCSLTAPGGAVAGCGSLSLLGLTEGVDAATGGKY